MTTGEPTAIVIDDDPEVAAMTVMMLSRCDIAGVTASTTEDARGHLTSGTRLVILDLTLPGGGAEALLHEVRAQHPDVAVVIATGHAGGDVQAHWRELGVDGFLTKPFRRADLERVVRSALAARPPRSSD